MTDTSHTLLISRQHWPLFVFYSVLSLSFDKFNFSYLSFSLQKDYVSSNGFKFALI